MLTSVSYRFALHKERNGSFLVRLRVTIPSKKPFDFSFGVSIPSKESWNASKNRVKSSTPNAYSLNKSIASIETAIDDIISKYEHVNKRLPSVDELKIDLSVATGRPSGIDKEETKSNDDLFLVFDKFVNTEGVNRQWTESSYEKFSALRKHLVEFDPMLRMSDITEEKMTSLVHFLTFEVKLNNGKKGMRNTTIAKQLDFFRWFLRWAYARNLYNGNVHDTFHPKIKGGKFEQKEVIYLTIEELQKVEQFQFQPNQSHLERTRDVFVFCCYTGLRFSDASKLTQFDIKEDHITIVTQKTNDLLHIELNNHSRAILDKYKDADWLKGKALPTISNQKSNDYLKEIGRVCGISHPVRIVYFKSNKRVEEVHPKYELLSTHCARRTFVVTALYLGISPEVVMKFTGHSGYQAMKPYIAIVDDLKKQAMDKFNNI